MDAVKRCIGCRAELHQWAQYTLCDPCYDKKYGKRCSNCKDFFCTAYTGEKPLCPKCFKTARPKPKAAKPVVDEDGFTTVRSR